MEISGVFLFSFAMRDHLLERFHFANFVSDSSKTILPWTLDVEILRVGILHQDLFVSAGRERELSRASKDLNLSIIRCEIIFSFYIFVRNINILSLSNVH